MLQRHQGRVAAQRRALAPSRQRVVKCDAAHALIVNTKSGGHAFIGYYLAKALRAQGHRVTILNDGNEVSTRTCSTGAGTKNSDRTVQRVLTGQFLSHKQQTDRQNDFRAAVQGLNQASLLQLP